MYGFCPKPIRLHIESGQGGGPPPGHFFVSEIVLKLYSRYIPVIFTPNIPLEFPCKGIASHLHIVYDIHVRQKDRRNKEIAQTTNHIQATGSGQHHEVVVQQGKGITGSIPTRLPRSDKHNL